MNDWFFGQPMMVHLLWLFLFFLGFLFSRRKKQESEFQSLFGTMQENHLVQRVSFSSRKMQLVWLGLGGFSLIVALMRPQKMEEEVISRLNHEADIMVVLDVSKSMLAEDAPPNRLERAKSAVLEMVDQFVGYRVGLVGFAGRASVLCPLTKDYSFFHTALQSASPLSISRGGTNIGGGLKKALQSFSDGQAARLIILITDGEDHDSFPMDTAKMAKEFGVPIVAIGFGDENGAEIVMTDPQTGVRTVIMDQSGKPVISRLDGELLREIALETDGVFVPAGVSSLDLSSIISEHIQPIVSEVKEEGKQLRTLELYPPFLSFSLLAFFLAIWTGIQREGAMQ